MSSIRSGRRACGLALLLLALALPTARAEETPLPDRAIAVLRADDGVHGAEPWVTDGTPGGTWLLRDLTPGPDGSAPEEFTALGQRVLFTVDGDELRATDGTPEGTRHLVTVPNDTRSGITLEPERTGRLGERLVFVANDPRTGGEPWVTDGTATGTHLLRDIAERGGSWPEAFVVLGDRLLFSAAGPDGRELWRTDGTQDGTELLRNIAPTGGSRPAFMVRVGDLVYFSADDGSHGRELWVTDGTALGTKMVVDLTPEGDSDARPRAELGGRLVFLADDGVDGQELWITDGTPVGSTRLTDSEGSRPETGRGLPLGFWEMASLGTSLVFVAPDAELGTELWITDGTVDGTRPLADIAPGAASSDPGSLVADGSSVWFSARDAVHGRELWRTDGTPEGTRIVTDLRPGHGDGLNGTLASTPKGLLFMGRDERLGWEPWLAEADQVALVKDISPGPRGSVPWQMGAFDR